MFALKRKILFLAEKTEGVQIREGFKTRVEITKKVFWVAATDIGKFVNGKIGEVWEIIASLLVRTLCCEGCLIFPVDMLVDTLLLEAEHLVVGLVVVMHLYLAINVHFHLIHVNMVHTTSRLSLHIFWSKTITCLGGEFCWSFHGFKHLHRGCFFP